MKLRYFPVILSFFYISLAHAEIYKRVDADGHVTYSNKPLKGAKKLHLTPLPTVAPHSPKNTGTANFPQVDSATQKGRDNTRRKILEDELSAEEKALEEARNNLQTGSENPETYTAKDGKIYQNVAKQDEKMITLQEQVQLHEKNIVALKTELSNNK